MNTEIKLEGNRLEHDEMARRVLSQNRRQDLAIFTMEVVGTVLILIVLAFLGHR